MSIFPEEDRPKPQRVHEIGQDLSTLSLAEIDLRVAALKQEIARLEQARISKAASRTAADSFFKKPE